MPFSIPCHVFARAGRGAFKGDDAQYPAIKGVRVQNLKGAVLVIATNRQFLTVDYVGQTDEPDGFVHVSPDLIEPCSRFAETDENLTITPAPGWTVAQIGMSYFHPFNASIEGAFPDWQPLIPTGNPSKPNGALGLNVEAMRWLAEVSPNGEFVLPTAYDIDKPVIVRDVKDPDWFAIFLSLEHRNQSFKPATLPTWFPK